MHLKQSAVHATLFLGWTLISQNLSLLLIFWALGCVRWDVFVSNAAARVFINIFCHFLFYLAPDELVCKAAVAQKLACVLPWLLLFLS